MEVRRLYWGHYDTIEDRKPCSTEAEKNKQSGREEEFVE